VKCLAAANASGVAVSQIGDAATPLMGGRHDETVMLLQQALPHCVCIDDVKL
jgi:hypothetical protein